ncbi:MAG: NADH-quinone oxidoreductase subunit NuoE [Clostridia bacterium]|nr:NADH-quinone oxidoreductase subunit NuoE [Bacillota bacterium]MBO2520921.1 NADH-quinone oxidoreductase subunit NuoE [Bacillota bacterium]
MSAPAWVEKHKEKIEEIIARYPKKRSALMPLLHLAQEERGWIADEDIEAVAAILGETKSVVESVCSFYSLFYRRPMGKYVITVCGNITCGLSGAQELVDHLERRLGIKVGETTPDGLITLLVTGECIAACDGAPALQVNLEYCGNVTPERADEIIELIKKGEDPAAISDRFGIPPVKAV